MHAESPLPITVQEFRRTSARRRSMRSLRPNTEAPAWGCQLPAASSRRTADAFSLTMLPPAERPCLFLCRCRYVINPFELRRPLCGAEGEGVCMSADFLALPRVFPQRTTDC